jgi:hypothetical protein
MTLIIALIIIIIATLVMALNLMLTTSLILTIRPKKRLTRILAIIAVIILLKI